MKKTLMTAVLAAGLSALLAAPATAAPPPLPVPKAKYGAKLDESLLGQHVHYLSNPGSNTTQKFGSIRIWDNQVRWDQVNPAPGTYDWTVLDQVVANAQAVGAKEILYVLGSTPLWAAKYPTADFTYYNGPGSASVPANIEDWKTWVRAVAERYKGRITAYQPWNESNLSAMFYAGEQDSAVAMADLTQAAQQVIREVDPAATFTTASSTVIQTKNYVKSGWFTRYLKALKQRGVKPDTISVHLYPWLKQGPANGDLKDREKGLDMAQQVMANTGYKKYELWDTEMNYGNMRDTSFNQWPKKKYSQKQGAAYRLPGARSGGCTPIGSISTCTIKRGSQKQYFVFRATPAMKTYTVPAKWKVRQACSVLDSCKPIRKGRVKVGQSPLLLMR